MAEPERRGDTAMALMCESCDVRLFGAEVEAGGCAHCAGKPRPARSNPGAFLGLKPREAPQGWGWAGPGVRLLQAATVCLMLALLALGAGLFFPPILPAAQCLCVP